MSISTHNGLSLGKDERVPFRSLDNPSAHNSRYASNRKGSVSTATKEARRCKSRSRKSSTGVGTTRPVASAASTQSPPCSSRSPFRSPLRRRTVAFPGKQPPALTASELSAGNKHREDWMKTRGSRILEQILKDVGQAQRRPHQSRDNCNFPQIWPQPGPK